MEDWKGLEGFFPCPICKKEFLIIDAESFAAMTKHPCVSQFKEYYEKQHSGEQEE